MAFDAKQEIVRCFFEEALVRFRGQEMPFLLAPGFRCEAWAALGVPDGPEGAQDYIARLGAAFSDSTAHVEEVTTEGGCVVVRFTFEAVHSGEFAEIPATGRRVSVPGVFVARFEGCRIAELRRDIDEGALLRQLQGSAAA